VEEIFELEGSRYVTAATDPEPKPKKLIKSRSDSQTKTGQAGGRKISGRNLAGRWFFSAPVIAIPLRKNKITQQRERLERSGGKAAEENAIKFPPN